MEVSPSRSPTSRFVQPFRLLGIDPAATDAEVEAAHVRALGQAATSDHDLADARSAILDPARRLLCELAYPIDSSSTQVETLFADLSGNGPTHDLLTNAARLAPLSRANFVASLAGHRPADANLLIALVDAHVSIDVGEIYTILKALRHQAGRLMPSLVQVSQGLSDLLAMHIEIIIGGYRDIQGAAQPMLECVRCILATPERYRVEVLSGLLDAYRRSTSELRNNACQRLEDACAALQQRPEDASSIEDLNDAMRLWSSLHCPLILLDDYQERYDRNVEIAVDQVLGLVDSLSVHRHFETAREVISLGQDAWCLVPGATEYFNDAASRLDSLWFESEAKPLHHAEGTLTNSAMADTVRDVERRDPAALPAKGLRSPPLGKTVLWACFALAGILGSFVVYGYFDSVSRFFAPTPAPSAIPVSEPEAVPPVGTGQRFPLEYVRYCHFQEERLRVIKQEVNGPQDIQAFNVLAKDYNSRCSNFYYQDGDLKIVMDQVNARRKTLEAEARQILATWPWHSAPDRPSAPPAK
jgi:hypothetical protein